MSKSPEERSSHLLHFRSLKYSTMQLCILVRIRRLLRSKLNFLPQDLATFTINLIHINSIRWTFFSFYTLKLSVTSIICLALKCSSRPNFWTYNFPSDYTWISGSGSSVGIATGYGLDGPGIESRWGRDFPHLSKPVLGPKQPPVQWVTWLSRR